MLDALKNFITECDGNEPISLDVKEKFNALSKDEQELILQSINSISVIELQNLHKYDTLPEEVQAEIAKKYKDISHAKRIYDSLLTDQRIAILQEAVAATESQGASESKGEKWEIGITVPEYKMLCDLQILLDGSTDLDKSIENTAGFKGAFKYPEPGESITFEDIYLIEQVTVQNINGKYFIDQNPVTITQKGGYAKLTYQRAPLRDKFLNQLEKSYYQKLAAEKKLDLATMANRGMLREAAAVKNDTREAYLNY